MLTEEQEKALLEEIDKLRQDKAALISRVASLEQSLYWLRKKVFGRMSEKNLPLDPNQLWKYPGWRMKSAKAMKKSPEP
mgnify:CR=1 FL=1